MSIVKRGGGHKASAMILANCESARLPVRVLKAAELSDNISIESIHPPALYAFKSTSDSSHCAYSDNRLYPLSALALTEVIKASKTIKETASSFHPSNL